jgi:hypothetical protein
MYVELGLIRFALNSYELDKIRYILMSNKSKYFIIFFSNLIQSTWNKNNVQALNQKRKKLQA